MTQSPNLESEEDFAAAAHENWLPMYRLAVRFVGDTAAADVVQDALLGAWRARERFDPRLGTWRAWLLAIAADHSRRALRRRTYKSGEDEPTVGDIGIAASRAVDMRRAVEGLSERQRLAVELFYYLDLPVAEVAQAMACAPGTVKSTLADARRNLALSLGKDYS